jgi:hypothetical protein
MNRYNPQSIEKHILCEFKGYAEPSLMADYKARTNALLEGLADPFPSPKIAIDGISNDILREYGIDACRLAKLSAPALPVPYSLLDSAYNWISKLYDSFNHGQSREFCIKPWLSALLQLPDHIIKRSKPRSAFALIQRAFNESRPTMALSGQEKLCVIACISPFTPILAEYLLKTHGLQKMSIHNIINSFEQYISISLQVGNGGWHREIVDKGQFAKNPLPELLKIKWVSRAVKNKAISVHDFAGGKQIVFTK